MCGPRVLILHHPFARRSRSDDASSWWTPFTSGRRSLAGKIPYAIGMKDGAPFVFAGLWEGWKDPATDEWLRTCTSITREPNDLVAQIHTRMPVILPEEDHTKWHRGLEA